MDPCKLPTCKPTRLTCVAKTLVHEVLCTAVNLIAEDPNGLLLYKRPFVAREDDDYVDSDDEEVILWCSIKKFTLTEGLSQLRDYVSSWNLSPATKFVLEPRSEKVILGRGRHILVDVIFSKPTYKCPNPISVAMAHFGLHVSSMLPPDYPIMVTYRFEGYKMLFYALGERCVRSIHFQRFYIDTILHIKLGFYGMVTEFEPQHVSKKSECSRFLEDDGKERSEASAVVDAKDGVKFK